MTNTTLTADTITDEQIRELRASIAGRVFPASGMAHTELSELHHDCETALCELDLETSTIEQRMASRSRCAAFINSSTKGQR